MMGWGNGGYGGYGAGGYSMMGIIILFILCIGIILVGMSLFRRNSSQVHTNILGEKNSGLEILRERYAHGEINSTEYNSQKRDLESK